MNDLWSIHTIVWDLDDTLILERDYVRSGYEAVGIWVEQTYGVTGFAERAWSAFAAGRRGDVFNHVLETFGIASAPDIIQRLVQVYRCHFPQLKLLPDAREALDWGKSAFAMALISDGYVEAQERKVEAVRVQDWVGKIILTGRWGREYWKPSVRAFNEVMASAISTRARGFVYIADNPRKDFIAPRSLGWRTVRIRRVYGEHFAYNALPGEGADECVESLVQLLDFIKPSSD